MQITSGASDKQTVERLDLVALNLANFNEDSNTRLDLVAFTLAAQKSTLVISATEAASKAVTATLPAVTDKFHIISYIEISMCAVDNLTGTDTPTVITTTNLPGDLSFTFPTALLQGEVVRQIMTPALPLKSLVSNTDTVILCPETPKVIWRINVFYTALE